MIFLFQDNAGRAGENAVVIWGTSINVEEVKASFKEFLETYRPTDPDTLADPTSAREAMGELPFYMMKFEEVLYLFVVVSL